MKNMDMEKWTQRSTDIREWLKHNDAGAMATLIEQTLDAGDDSGQPEELDRFWEAVRAICKTLPNTPIKQGRGSTLAPAIQACVDGVVNRIETAFAAIGDSDLLLEVMLPHGKTGGSYADIDAFAHDMATKAQRVLKAALKEERWNGTMTDDGLTGLTPPVKDTTDNEEEVEDSMEDSA